MNRRIKHRQSEVAFSFASEDAKQISHVVREVAERGITVFRYERVKALTWGQSLSAVLRDIFQKRSRLCVAFISKHSATKPWTTYERRFVRASRLLPVRLDDSNAPDLDPDVVFIDLRTTPPEELARLIEQRLALLPSTRWVSLLYVALLAALLVLVVYCYNAIPLRRVGGPTEIQSSSSP
jgi:hypothetical protein